MKPVTALLTATLCWGLTTTVHAADDTRYVRDWISVALRESPAKDSAVVGRGLVSGTPLTLLESDQANGLSRVRTETGAEGWLPSRYLTAEPVARALLDQANAELEQLRQLNQQLRGDNPATAAAIDGAKAQVEQLQQANEALTAEVAALKQSPDNPANLKQSNQDLQVRNETLRQQLEQLNAEVSELRASRENEMFRNGALAVIGGVLITLVVPRLWPKKRSEWA